MPVSHEIAIWIDADKYEALSEHLNQKELSVEKATGRMIEKLYRDVVPVDQRAEITRRAEAEQQRKEKEDAERRRFALFKITKNGRSISFEDEFYTDNFTVAMLLRRFLRGEDDIGDNFFNGTPRQKNTYRTSISLDKFNEQASMFNNIKQILRVFDIDLDHGYISIGDKQRGCTTYRTKDVVAAVYYAAKAESRGNDEA